METFPHAKRRTFQGLEMTTPSAIASSLSTLFEIPISLPFGLGGGLGLDGAPLGVAFASTLPLLLVRPVVPIVSLDEQKQQAGPGRLFFFFLGGGGPTLEQLTKQSFC